MKQLLELYGDVQVFLTRYNQAPTIRPKLFQDQAFLEVELAIIIDACMPFVQATYKLEGDGHLAFECYEVISSATPAVNMAQLHYPNTQAVTRRLSSSITMLSPVHDQVCSTIKSISHHLVQLLQSGSMPIGEHALLWELWEKESAATTI